MMDMSCADRDGGTLLLRDIQSFNEFWKQMVPPRGHKSIVVLTLALNTTNFFLRLMENFTLLDKHITTLSCKWKINPFKSDWP